MMRAVWIALLAAAFMVGVGEPAEAARKRLYVLVDISQQTMHVYRSGRKIHRWAVSTGKRGYRTPTGRYRPKWLSRHHRSRKYHGAPMPYAIFFRGGYAVHGTYETRRLGRPASHGCVRLRPSHARRLFRLVRAHGLRNVTIHVRR